MTTKDLITLIGLVTGLIWVGVFYVLVKREILTARTMPWALTITSAVFAFTLLMTGSVLSRPLTDVFEYTVTNLVGTLGISLGGFITARGIAKKMKK
jgi:hypothetical protein